jgi:excisionase family DNA binding protein
MAQSDAENDDYQPLLRRKQEGLSMRKDTRVTWASVAALAKVLGISRNTAYAGLRDGTIPALRIGRRYILPKAAIAKWLESAARLPTSLGLKKSPPRSIELSQAIDATGRSNLSATNSARPRR